MKDTLSLLTALPHIQHAIAKAEKATFTFIIMGLPCQAIWSTAWSPLSEVNPTLRGGYGEG